jgi:hypothetical protein
MSKDAILWACEREHEQMNPMESFQKYISNINEILFDT